MGRSGERRMGTDSTANGVELQLQWATPLDCTCNRSQSPPATVPAPAVVFLTATVFMLVKMWSITGTKCSEKSNQTGNKMAEDSSNPRPVTCVTLTWTCSIPCPTLLPSLISSFLCVCVWTYSTMKEEEEEVRLTDSVVVCFII